MSDFLLELLSEEIPARMQAKASAELARLFAEEIGKASLTASAIESYATPRRLALIARGLPEATEAVSEEIKGPRAGAPPQALEGFLRKTGLTVDQLVERDGILFAQIDKPGRATAAVLAEAIPAIVRAFPWPKSMRWGDGTLRWVRPLQGIVALLGDDVVPFEIGGIASGAATLGHRFHHPGMITIGNADDYAAKLRACHVVLDPAERQAIIRERAAALAAEAGLAVVPDEGLVAENAGLTEWPVPLLGSFDPAFLEVPREVIQLTMRTNQKYFACVRADGSLAPNFICTANIEAADGGAAIAAGNARVLSARLSDARFFWEQDLKVPLEEQGKKLGEIVFHEKLGTVDDKVERVARLSRWLVEEGIVKGADPQHAVQAARLCKADLVTAMVGEFPELQGVMGGYYARANGLSDEVADAIRDHYKPVGQGDEVPTAPVTVAVSLADKLDTLLAYFGVGEIPSGSRDPYALRRSALAVIGILQTSSLRLKLLKMHAFGLQPLVYQYVYRETRKVSDVDATALAKVGVTPALVTTDQYRAANLDRPEIKAFVEGFGQSDRTFLAFFADRLKVQQREAGVRHDLIDAVFALGGEDDLVRLLARVKALQAFVATEEGANLLAGYKRAANILKRENWDDEPDVLSDAEEQGAAQTGEEDPLSMVEDPDFAEAVARLAHPTALSYAPEGEEADLLAALDAVEPRAAAAVEAEDFAAAMAALAELRGPIDRFFEKVTVNDPDPGKRKARLGMLARVRDAVRRVADFSKIEG